MINLPMKRRILGFTLGVLAVLVAWAQVTTAKKLTPDELKALAGGNQKFFFLDVREPKELEELGTLRGYVNIPLGELEKRLSEIPKDVLVVSACNRAVRAAKAAAILEKNGYKQIQICAMNEYKEKGYDLIYPKAAQKPEEKPASK
jgi:rhodanese-related sulfurtransferase